MQITHNLKNVLILNVMLQTIWALLDNRNVNIEPYVSSILYSLTIASPINAIDPDMSHS